MTTASPQHARLAVVQRLWRAFRGWRRSRPFWGGLLTALAGLEIFLTTQTSLSGLTFQLGPTGFLSWLIPTILVTCGLLLWFTPQHRMFYAIIAAMTAVYSLIAVNLGGFLIGLLLGMVGSALGFAWVPLAQPTAPKSRWRRLAVIPRRRRTAEPADTHPPLAAIVLITLVAAPIGVAAVNITPAQADPCPPPAQPTAPVTTEPEVAGDPAGGENRRSSDGNVLTDIIDGVVDLLVPGRGQAEPTPEPTPTASPSAGPSEEPDPEPTGCTSEPGTGPTDGRPDPQEPTKDVVKPTPIEVLDTPAGQPRVVKTPSLMTGSKVRMLNLRLDGLVDLPTADGTIRVLQFSMDRAVTEDFRLRVTSKDKTTDYLSNTLTVSGNVKFYATRFTGRLVLAGLETPLVITLSVEKPLLPDGFPLPIPGWVSFTDPEIDLVFVDCDKLTARPLNLVAR